MTSSRTGSPIRLELEPLTEAGTRVIVPFLSPDAVDSITGGELVRWLERCWWRAVQKGELVITVGVENGDATTVTVPQWWANEPWERPPPSNSLLKENVRLERGNQRIIKRIFLTHEPDLRLDEIDNAGPQYSGVQLLRRNQWVEKCCFPLSHEQLEERAQSTGYLQLQPEENWAAWEAMGYTKVGEDSLGSRGQGKAAFLYHSRHESGLRGPGGSPLERMVILYDTLLDDGAYRLGVRIANPADQVLSPPV